MYIINFDKLNTYSDSLFYKALNNSLEMLPERRPSIIDKLDVAADSLSKSRGTQEAKKMKVNAVIGLGKSIPKEDPNISDYKWGLMVALGEKAGFSDATQIENMNITDVYSEINETVSYSALADPEYSDELIINEGKVQAGTNAVDLSSGEKPALMLAEEAHAKDWFNEGDFGPYRHAIRYADSRTYSANLADASEEELELLWIGLNENDEAKIDTSINSMLGSGVMTVDITKGERVIFPTIDKAITDQYYQQGINEKPEGVGAYIWGMLQELGKTLNIEQDHLLELDLNDLSKYMKKYNAKHENTKLVDMSNRSLYYIVEGIKNDDSELFNFAFL